VRLLIEIVRGRVGEERFRAAADDDNILDIEVDGFRCVLTASWPASPFCQRRLSPREEQIARMVAAGYPNKTIAAALKISTWTVSTHLRRIFVKFDVHSRAAMVARLFEGGFVADPSEPVAGASAASSPFETFRPPSASRARH